MPDQRAASWQNWAETIQFNPLQLYSPTTINELRAVLGAAGKSNTPVRAVGSGHSWSVGAVPGKRAYTPGDSINACLLDLTGLSPLNSAAEPYLRARYFADASNNYYVAIPPGTRQGWLAFNLGNAIGHPLEEGYDPDHRVSDVHPPLALGSMGPAADINLGGFVANGCHGTGWNRPTVSDLVAAIELLTFDTAGNVVPRAFCQSQEIAALLVKNQVTLAAPEVAPSSLLAASCAMGALGVITKIVLKTEPLFHVGVLDETAPRDLLFPPDGDPKNLEALVASGRSEYVELYWFPYNDNLWVKRFTRALTDQEQNPDGVLRFNDFMGRLAEATGDGMAEWFAAHPRFIPNEMKLVFGGLSTLIDRKLHAESFFDDFDLQQDSIVPLHDAFIYQTRYSRNVLDFEYTIPIPGRAGGGYDFSGVQTAWRTAMAHLDEMGQQGRYPITICAHLRFVKNSRAPLSPAWQESPTTHTCYIEFVSYKQQLTDYNEFIRRVGKDWAALGGLPNWAKHMQAVDGIYADCHARLQARGALQPFLDLRAKLDPKGLFMNDFLNQLLLGLPPGT